MVTDLVRDVQNVGHQPHWQEALRHAVSGIAGLTAVDGAMVITTEFELMAFGATIGRRNGGHEINRVILHEPFEGSTPHLVEAGSFGGTRHISAAQFVGDQPDSLALVASQDGRFSIFSWSPSQQMVQAHRVEALLL